MSERTTAGGPFAHRNDPGKFRRDGLGVRLRPRQNRQPPMSTVTLRPWQRAAFDRYRSSPAPDFLAVATPGAGKTTFALACARATLADWVGRRRRRRRLVVVAPTSHLKIQWSLAAHRLGLQLDPDWSPGQGLARDVHGLVTTYQQVATGKAANALRGLTADGMVILDEIHHAGHERAWGDGVFQAFELAAKRLSLSGTPFRSDSAKIPFVRYDVTAEGDLAHADYTYGYADALARRWRRAPRLLPPRRRADGVEHAVGRRAAGDVRRRRWPATRCRPASARRSASTVTGCRRCSARPTSGCARCAGSSPMPAVW